MSTTEDAAPEAPKGVDTEKPAAARVYDWFLGGTHNWAVDREFGRRMEQRFPYIRSLAQQNRAFLGRAVRAALASGVRQFLDLGSGVPTAGNVHEVVAGVLPEGETGKVVYVDYEAVATAHATVLLEQQEVTGWAGIVQADVRNVDAVLDHPLTKELIDFEEPVCLLMVAVLPFVGPDDHPGELVRTYRDLLRPGSWLALSHGVEGCLPAADAERARDAVEQYRHTTNPVWVRSREDIAGFFGDWEIVEPGLTPMPDWRPDGEIGPVEAASKGFALCGAAVKR